MKSQLPKTVLMTADTIGGVWTYALELARMFRERGIAVALATMGAPLDQDQREEVRKLENVTVFGSRFKLEWMEDPQADVERAGEWLLNIERRVEPEVVHLNNFVHAALPFHAPILTVGHSCVLSWWEAVKGRPAPGTWIWYRDQVTRGLRDSDRIIAPSRAMLTALRKHYGPLPASGVIPNGRDPRAFVPAPKKNFVLAAGRLWDEAKNLQALAAVAPELPWEVCVAGDVKHPIRGEAAAPRLRWLGRLSPGALAAWYGRAAIYALPARYEPFGLSVLEAALSGCGLVLGDIPSLRETWADAAVFVSPDDNQGLKSALEELINNPRYLRELADKARTRAFDFSPDRMAAGYLSAYSDLMATGFNNCAGSKAA